MLLRCKLGWLLIANTLRSFYLKETVNTIPWNSTESSTGCWSKQVSHCTKVSARSAASQLNPRGSETSKEKLCHAVLLQRYFTLSPSPSLNTWRQREHKLAPRLDRHQWLQFAELALVLVGQPSPRSIWQFDITKKSNFWRTERRHHSFHHSHLGTMFSWFEALLAPLTYCLARIRPSFGLPMLLALCAYFVPAGRYGPAQGDAC